MADNKTDGLFAGKARTLMLSAKAAPKRAELELNHAENTANLVKDKTLKAQLLKEVNELRKKLLKK